MYFVLFFVELFILFLLSNILTQHLSSFFYRITHSRKATIYLLAILFFPGTFIHEISHYVMARLLFVRAYQIEFFPKLHGETVKLGSVTMERSDFFRRLLIGMAPFFFGTVILLGSLYYAVTHNWQNNYVLLLIIGYCLFEIGNTMFSSKKDMEGAVELIAVCLVIGSLLFFFDVHISSINPSAVISNPVLVKVFQKGTYFLLAPLLIDGIVIGILKLLK